MSKVKDKERFLKVTRENLLVIYKGTHVRQQTDFSVETRQVKREWDNIFKELKEKTVNWEYAIWQSSPLTLKGRSNFTKLKKFFTIRLDLQEILKEVLQAEMNSAKYETIILTGKNKYVVKFRIC